jgi:hypothetical protein
MLKLSSSIYFGINTGCLKTGKYSILSKGDLNSAKTNVNVSLIAQNLIRTNHYLGIEISMFSQSPLSLERKCRERLIEDTQAKSEGFLTNLLNTSY